MAKEADELIAFSDERAAHLAGVGLPTLRRWESTRLVRPSVARKLSPRNTIRLYGFHDLEALLVVSTLRRDGRFSLKHIRRVVNRLKANYENPLTELRFAFDPGRREICFQHPDGTWEGDRRPDQIILSQVIDLMPIRARIRGAAMAGREAGEQGRIQRHRKVLGSRPVFAGTRIPVAAVVEYIEDGFDDAAIIEAFPRLTPADVTAAREQSAAV